MSVCFFLSHGLSQFFVATSPHADMCVKLSFKKTKAAPPERDLLPPGNSINGRFLRNAGLVADRAS